MRTTRTIKYSVIEDGCIRREVVLSDGRHYTQHCTKAVYESVAFAVTDGKPHTCHELARTLNEPFTQVDIAFQFLSDRGIVVVGRARRSYAQSNTAYEDAMVEYHSLREVGPVTIVDLGNSM